MAKKSWLQKKEQKKALRQTLLFFASGLVVLFLLFRFGLPALVKLAGFFADLKSAGQLIEKQDKIRPAPPKFDYVDKNVDQRLIEISGQSEPASLVKVYRNGSVYKEVITSKKGKFKLDDVKLKNGKNVFTATAWDVAGNESAQSKSLQIVFDQEPPNLEINKPKDGSRFFDENNQIKVTGLTEKDAQVKVNNRRAIINSQGFFEVNLVLDEGENEIKIIAKDEAGNETEKSLKVEYIP